MELYLEFDIDNVVTQEQLTEMVGYDAFANKLKQGANRWGRDEVIGADEIDLTFWNDVYVADERGFFDQHGYPITFATHCFDKLMDAFDSKNKGFEATVRLVLKQNGVVFISGELDGAESTTDEVTYFSCNIVVETKSALLARRIDLEPDVFSSTDVDGKPIVPLERIKFLQKALPEFQQSEYATPELLNKTYISYGGDAFFFNPAFQAVGTLGIEDSYLPNGTGIPGEISANTQAYTQMEPGYDTDDLRGALDRFKLFTARDEYTNLTIDISEINLFVSEITGFSTNKSFTLVWGNDVVGDNEAHRFIDNESGTVNIVNGQLSHTIPFLSRGQTVWLYFSMASFNPAPAGGAISSTSISGASWKVKGTVYSTAIDVVIETVRYEDYFAKGVEQLCGLPLYAPRIQTGEFKSQFVCNGNMLQAGSNRPLNFLFKNEAEDLKLLRLDYQSSETVIDIASKDDFYPNNDLGFLDIDAPVDLERKFNDRMKMNAFNVEFKNYEKSDDTKNTVESFHTKGQWGLLNEKVSNNITISINAVFDPKKIQKMIQQSLRETVATDNDNTIIRIDGIELSPGTKGGFSGIFGMQTSNGILTILNKNGASDIPAVFKWTQTGIVVGQQFDVYYQGVLYRNTVVSIENTIIRLQPVGYVSSFNNNNLIRVEFVYSGVLWTNRTIEGLTDISGISTPERWSNLRFGVGNILDYYSSDINEIMTAYPDGVSKNLSFINNPDFTARYNGGRLIKQGGNLPISECRPKVLDTIYFSTQMKVSFEMGVYILTATKKRNPDDTIGGFFRIRTKKGIRKIHIDDSENEWRDGILHINKGVVRNESDYVTIIKIGNVFYINGASYELGIDWFEVNPDENFTAFDRDNKEIINPTNYQKVSINGNTYNNVVDFVAALENV